MSLPSSSLPDFEAYYDAATRQYWIRNSRGGWVEVRESSLRRHLRGLGYRTGIQEGEKISQIETLLNTIQIEKDVAYLPWQNAASGWDRHRGNSPGFRPTFGPLFLH